MQRAGFQQHDLYARNESGEVQRLFLCGFEAKIQTVLIFIIELENYNIFYIRIKAQGDKELEDVRFITLGNGGRNVGISDSIVD